MAENGNKIEEDSLRTPRQRSKGASGAFTPEEISPADVETVLYSAVPRSRQGNPLPVRASTLAELFFSKRPF